MSAVSLSKAPKSSTSSSESVTHNSAEGERPPPYHDDSTEGEAVAVVQQTTTTITTTTTTSFFPFRRRKISKVEPVVGHNVIQSEPTESLVVRTLSVNKELPAIPKEQGGKAKTRRPRTAEAAVPPRRDSLFAMSMPVALAHAHSMLPQSASLAPNETPASTPYASASSVLDPVDRQTTPRPLSPMSSSSHSTSYVSARDKRSSRGDRRSLSVSIDNTSFMSDAFSTPQIRLGNSLDYSHSPHSSTFSPTTDRPFTATPSTSAFSPNISSTGWASPISVQGSAKAKSKTIQSLSEAEGPQIKRRASWWGRRKPDLSSSQTQEGRARSGSHSIQTQSSEGGRDLKDALAGLTGGGKKSSLMRKGTSAKEMPHPTRTASAMSITPKAALAQLLPSPSGNGSQLDLSGRRTIDLTNSPPPDDALNGRSSQSAPLSPTTIMEHQSDSQINLSQNLKPPSPQLTRANSASKRPRALSLFLRPTPTHEEVIQATNSPTGMTPGTATASPGSPIAPSSAVAHARPRTAGAGAPLLRRLSSTLFNHSPYSSPSATPNSSLSLFTSDAHHPTAATSVPSVPIPRPLLESHETPHSYIDRLLEVISKAEVAGVLASKSDAFHEEALRVYLERWDFAGKPLDIAVRMLLMESSLPRETQQIDRVVGAFAHSYEASNPGLYAQQDQAYVLAFSLIMLHTDAFNKSNKNKMGKAAYVKNTRLPGVQPEVLEYFYDNIVFAPFIFIEDPMDVNGQRGFSTDSTPSSSSFLSKPKIDPYYLIISNLLDPLRVPVFGLDLIPKESPYQYLGTAEAWDHEELRHAFAEAVVVELGDRDLNRRFANPAFSGFTSTPPHLIPMALGTHGGMSPGAFNDVWTFKLTKIGIVNRKEDVGEGGKRTGGRKWRQYKVALTGSQLLFFRDLKWDQMLIEKKAKEGSTVLTLPHASLVKPDEVISVNDAVALFDTSYTKYHNTFRLVLPQGRQYLMQVLDSHELNEWLARINYASAFRTAGLRMRPTGLSGRDVELTGIAAANSHVRETLYWQNQAGGSSPQVHNWASPDLEKRSHHGDEEDSIESGEAETANVFAPKTHLLPVSKSNVALHVESAEEMVHEDAEQLKAAFEDVKAELKAVKSAPLSRRISNKLRKSSSVERLSMSTERPTHERDIAIGRPKERLSSRGTVIQMKIAELDKRIASIQMQLDLDLRCAMNLAILTPFQQSTRIRLQEHVLPLAKRIKQLRLELVKLQCHREVLREDFIGDERQRYQTTRAALKIATRTLKQRRGEPVSPTSDGESSSVMAGRVKVPKPILPTRNPSRRQNSFASSSSSTHEGSIPTLVHHATEGSQAPRRSLPSLTALSPKQEGASALDKPRPMVAEEFGSRSRAEDEQAEDWSKTKAAKRVSLVRVHRQSLRPLATRLHLDEALVHLQETPSSADISSANASSLFNPSYAPDSNPT